MTPVNYAKLNEQIRRHHVRYKQFIDTMPRKLVCQECRGSGEFHESILDYGEGPDYPCGFCEGTGFVTPHMRGQWLRWKRNGEL
jgi:DnaJ-class molecular chaperone